MPKCARNGGSNTINLCPNDDGIALKVGPIEGPLLSTEQHWDLRPRHGCDVRERSTIILSEQRPLRLPDRVSSRATMEPAMSKARGKKPRKVRRPSRVRQKEVPARPCPVSTSSGAEIWRAKEGCANCHNVGSAKAARRAGRSAMDCRCGRLRKPSAMQPMARHTSDRGKV